MSGDGIRVVDDDTKGLLVDQTIEKVSFCAPDRSHERGFSYICRDGTTRRWMCHGFLASKDSGERLSHAVGCAFAVCLERKQRRDKECAVTMTFDMKNSTFTRTGSFRQQTMTERLVDPPSAAVAPQPQKSSYNPFAIERPHATPSMLERQGSFRGFTQIGAQSPFKRQMSLRINDLPSNAERQRAFLDAAHAHQQRIAVSPIPEVSPQQIDTVSELCKELSQGLSMLSKDTENFLNFEKLTNGILNASNANANHIPSPPSCPTSIVTPYRPLNTSVPFGTAAPIQHQSANDESLVPTRYNSLVAVETTTTITSIAENRRTPSPFVNDQSEPQKVELTRFLFIKNFIKIIYFQVVPVEATNPLPKAEQWLTEIVKSTSPAPKRAPSFMSQSRSKSLATVDPFESVIGNWLPQSQQTSNITTTQAQAPPIIHSTNPFISPSKNIQQSFQVQL